MKMASRIVQTYQNKAKNLYTIYFVFDLDGECKFITTKYVLLSCHLGWMNRRRFCLQKGGSQEHISLITDRQTDRQTLEAASKGAAAACRSSNETQQRSLVLFVGTKSGATGSYRRTGGLQHPRVLWKGLQVCYCK